MARSLALDLEEGHYFARVICWSVLEADLVSLYVAGGVRELKLHAIQECVECGVRDAIAGVVLEPQVVDEAVSKPFLDRGSELVFSEVGETRPGK